MSDVEQKPKYELFSIIIDYNNKIQFVCDFDKNEFAEIYKNFYNFKKYKEFKTLSNKIQKIVNSMIEFAFNNKFNELKNMSNYLTLWTLKNF
jgi:hypothetical protein